MEAADAIKLLELGENSDVEFKRNFNEKTAGQIICSFFNTKGGLPEGINLNDLKTGHLSVLRNPDIAQFFYLNAQMEKVGRGSLLILKEMKENKLPVPVWSMPNKKEVMLTFYAPEATPEATPEVKRLLIALEGEMSRKELQDRLGLKDPDHFRKAYIDPAMAGQWIELTIPDKPQSPGQKYRLTSLGKKIKNFR